MSIWRFGATTSNWSAPAQAGLRTGRRRCRAALLAIEYQGSFVKVMLDTIQDDDFIAYVPERTFFRDPFNVGDVLLATWSAGRARVLA